MDFSATEMLYCRETQAVSFSIWSMHDIFCGDRGGTINGFKQVMAEEERMDPYRITQETAETNESADIKSKT